VTGVGLVCVARQDRVTPSRPTAGQSPAGRAFDAGGERCGVVLSVLKGHYRADSGDDAAYGRDDNPDVGGEADMDRISKRVCLIGPNGTCEHDTDECEYGEGVDNERHDC
jgi:hypothetical protein